MKITRRSLALGAPLAVAAHAARAADAAPILIGYPAALTGPSSAPGVGQNRGVTYIVDQINAAGGVKGRKIQMVTRDTQGDPAKAVNAVQEMMASYNVHAIFGPNNSGEALATTPIVARRGIPNIHCCGITSLIDEKKFPNAFRQTPNNGQSSDPPRIYCQKVLKLSKVAVIGDSTGYGTSAVTDSVTNFKNNNGDVVYQAQIDATQPDLMPDMLRMRDAGAQAIIPWTVSTGLIARLLNARGAMGWDVPFVGHQAMGSGEVGHLLQKPEYWNNVFNEGFKNCSFDAAGKLPALTQDFIDRARGKISLANTSLWWIVSAVDAIQLVAEAVGKTDSSSPEAIIGYWNTLTKYPGLFADYTFSPTQHNGFPSDELVMSVASSEHDGAYALAPGYT
ncbi:MAG TPA: ABC transporter substrate-binding protein [Acetobacteraceae bacterium]|nr:ABC transporter substrate-binding protein [Acetobacteraceae bacterium]